MKIPQSFEQLSYETNRCPPNTKINNQSDWVETMDTMCSSQSPYFHFPSSFVIYLPKKKKIFKRKHDLVVYLNDKPLACWLKHSAAVSHRTDRKREQKTFFDCCASVCVCALRSIFLRPLFLSLCIVRCESQHDDDECWFCSTWHSQRCGWQNRKYYYFSSVFTTFYGFSSVNWPKQKPRRIPFILTKYWCIFFSFHFRFLVIFMYNWFA